MENQKQSALQQIEAVYSENLSFWEWIVFAKLYTILKPNDLDFCNYTLSLSNFTLENTVLFSALTEGANRLLERKIKWTTLDADDNIHVSQTNLLTSVDGFSKNNEPCLALTIHPKLKQVLLAAKTSAKPLPVLQAPFLRIGTNLRLYGVMLQNLPKNGHGYVVELEKLKDILHVSDKYTLYANFKIKVLEEAQRRFLQEFQTTFHFGEIKEGKKVTAIRFRMDTHPLLSLSEMDDIGEATPSRLFRDVPSISKPKQQEIALDLITDSPSKLLINKDLMQRISEKLGVAPRMLKKLSEDFTEESLRQALVLTEKAIEKGSIKGSPAGYFVEAVRQNYQLPEEEEKEKKQAEALKKAEALAKIEAEQRQLKENLKRQEFEIERDTILDELAKNSELRQTITERIRYSIFHASYDVAKSFDANLENPSFLAAVLNFYKIVR